MFNVFVFLIYLLPIFFTSDTSQKTIELDKKHPWRNKNENIIQKWEFELDDNLDYPRGDKDKLHRLSQSWRAYYSCCERLARRSRGTRRAAGAVRAAAERARAQLPCALCAAPAERNVRWTYSPVTSSQMTFSSLEYDERMVVGDDGSLTVYDVRREDAGAYRCTQGQSAGGTIFLEVVDDSEPYDVVKPPTSHGPYATPPRHFYHNGIFLKAFTAWSAWSDCSACARVGRRRRYGMCYVTTGSNNMTYVIHSNTSGNEQDLVTQNFLKLLQEFPDGLPCRSRLLPPNLRNVPTLAARRNEIMIGICKVPCEKDFVFSIRSQSGAWVERADSARGAYSLAQRAPRRPPAPACRTVFASVGRACALACPGTSLKNIPVNWRIGTKALVPRDVDKSSGGRVHLNAKDNLVFAELKYGDSNLYSCWQRDALVGAVKLEVWDARPYWNSHLMLLATLLIAGAVLRACDSVLRNKRRRLS